MNSIRIGCPQPNNPVNRAGFTVCGTLSPDVQMNTVRVKLIIMYPGGSPANYTTCFDPGCGAVAAGSVVVWQSPSITGASAAPTAYLVAELHGVADCSDPAKATSTPAVPVAIVNSGPGVSCNGACALAFAKMERLQKRKEKALKKATTRKGAKVTTGKAKPAKAGAKRK